MRFILWCKEGYRFILVKIGGFIGRLQRGVILGMLILYWNKQGL